MKKSFYAIVLVLLLIGQQVCAQKNKPLTQATRNDKREAERLATFYRDTARFSVSPLPLNSRYAEFSAVFFRQGLFYNVVKTKQKYTPTVMYWPRRPHISIYYLPHIDSIHQQQKVQMALQNSGQHNAGLMHTIADSAMVVFTRSEPIKKPSQGFFDRLTEMLGKGKTNDRLGIYEARINDNVWFNIKNVFPKKRNFSVAHPTLSPDGNVLYFASDKLKGYGGSDIYVCFRENDRWTEPVNLGGVINSAADEMFPFIHEDGNLYFASNRSGGMGGFDIYEAIKGSEGFSRIANLGAPVNSVYDDFSLVLNQPKRMGLFTSNRSGNLDLYRLNVKLLNISRNLTDGGSNVFGTMSIEINGQVIDSLTNQPVKRALIKIRDFNNDDIKVAFADNKGRYKFIVTNENKYQIAASKIGYNTTTDYQFSTYGITNSDPLSIDILMTPVSYNLTLDVTVQESSTSLEETAPPLADAVLQLKEMESGKVVEQKTDSRGNFRFALVQGKNYRLLVSKENYQNSLPYSISTMNKSSAEVIQLNIMLAKMGQANTEQVIVKAIVKDRQDKKPIAKAQVTLHDLMSKTQQSRPTDDKGIASFEIDTTHVYSLESTKERYQLDNYVQVMPRNIRTGSVIEVLLPMKPVSYEPVPLDFNIPAIYYPPGKTTFDGAVMKQLDQVYDMLNKYKSIRISIIGHTDNTGDKEANLVLSQKRANAALNYLLKKGLPRTRIVQVTGMGESAPIHNCEKKECTPEQQSQNRRTEIVIVER